MKRNEEAERKGEEEGERDRETERVPLSVEMLPTRNENIYWGKE